MKRYLLIFLLFLLLFLGSVLWTERQNDDGFLAKTQTFVKSWNRKAGTDFRGAHNVTNSSASISGEVSDEFKMWVQTESLEIEKSSVDPQKKELVLKEYVKNLRTEEARYLKDLILSATSSANQKILSVYLLSLSIEKFDSLLLEVIQAPLNFSGAQVAHSPEETLAMQEKTLRRMALDALLERARKDPQFRSDVKTQVPQINDNDLRNYAEEKLRQMK